MQIHMQLLLLSFCISSQLLCIILNFIRQDNEDVLLQYQVCSVCVRWLWSWGICKHFHSCCWLPLSSQKLKFISHDEEEMNGEELRNELNTEHIANTKKIVKFLARAFLSFSTNCVLYSVDSRLDSIAAQQLNTHQSLFFQVLYRRCRCRRRRRLFLELSFGTISLSVATSKSKAVEWVSNWKNIPTVFCLILLMARACVLISPAAEHFSFFQWVLKLLGWRWWIFKKWKITTKTI